MSGKHSVDISVGVGLSVSGFVIAITALVDWLFLVGETDWHWTLGVQDTKIFVGVGIFIAGYLMVKNARKTDPNG